MAVTQERATQETETMTGFPHGTVRSAGIRRATPASPCAGNSRRRGLLRAGVAAFLAAPLGLAARRANAAGDLVKPEERGEMIAGYPADEQRSVTGAAFRRQVLYHAEGLKETGVLKPSTDPACFTDRSTVDLLGS